MRLPNEKEKDLRVGASSDLVDGHRQQRLVAQELADLARAVAFQDAAELASLGVECRVFESGHYSSRVTRSSSSSEVTPESTFARPSSRMPGVTSRAWRSSSCSLARS